MRRVLLNIATAASMLLLVVALLWPAWPIYNTTGSLGLEPFRTHPRGLLDVREFPDGTLLYFPSTRLLWTVIAVSAVLPALRVAVWLGGGTDGTGGAGFPMGERLATTDEPVARGGEDVQPRQRQGDLPRG